MKKILFVIALYLVQYTTTAQTTLDTVKNNVQALAKKADTTGRKVDSLLLTADKLVKEKAGTSACATCKDVPVKGGLSWLLIFLPAIIFMTLFVIMLSYGLSSFNLNGALAESEYPKITVLNPEYTSDNIGKLAASENVSEILPTTIDISNAPAKGEAAPPSPSISRYIAFITSMLTLVVALCMSCFFIYHYIRTGCAPDLSTLSTILIALGVGIVPYAFNKVSTAISKNKSD